MALILWAIRRNGSALIRTTDHDRFGSWPVFRCAEPRGRFRGSTCRRVDRGPRPARAKTCHCNFNAVDTITDFAISDVDVLELSDLISGYTSGVDDISEWVQIADDCTDSTLSVDTDGTASRTNDITVASLLGTTGLTDDAMLGSNGNLIATRGRAT